MAVVVLSIGVPVSAKRPPQRALAAPTDTQVAKPAGRGPAPSAARRAVPPRVRAVSVLELALNPRPYARMRIDVTGILSLHTPDNGLYAFREAYDHVTRDYVMMVLPLESTDKFSHLHGRWVRVIGTFRLWKSGKEGSIDDIESIEPALERDALFSWPPIR